MSTRSLRAADVVTGSRGEFTFKLSIDTGGWLYQRRPSWERPVKMNGILKNEGDPEAFKKMLGKSSGWVLGGFRFSLKVVLVVAIKSSLKIATLVVIGC